MPSLEAAQRMLSDLVAVQWEFGGDMWELRAARAEARCACCSECRKGAGKWLRRQVKQRERLEKQGKDADLEVGYRRPGER